MASLGDANVGFTLTPDGRTRLLRVLDAFAEALPQASAVLIDRAGRIVEVAHKPLGVKLEAISALAAGCFASTHELAGRMGEKEFSLLFEHDDDRQVAVWPVGTRALLVVLLKGADALALLEQRLQGALGQELTAVIEGAREPLQSMPPPRINPETLPSAAAEQMRALNLLIMDLQANRAGEFTPEVSARLLRDREELLLALSRENWALAGQVCEATTRRLKDAFR